VCQYLSGLAFHFLPIFREVRAVAHRFQTHNAELGKPPVPRRASAYVTASRWPYCREIQSR
jgi:hypothetical protein